MLRGLLQKSTQVLGVVTALALSQSCGRSSSTGTTSLSGGNSATAESCGLSDDQVASLLAPLETVPVRITVDAGLDEVEAIRYAANEWKDSHANIWVRMFSDCRR